MYTLDFKWSTIKNWTSLGLTHHDDVARLIETDRQLDAYVTAPSETLPSVTDPATVIAAVEAQAEYLALRGGHNSPLSRAIAGARNTIAHQGIAAATSNIDHYIEQLGDRFDPAAERYRESVMQLPDTFEADDLASFSPEVFTAYRNAVEAAAEIRQTRDFLTSLAVITPGTRDEGHSAHFLVLDPGTPEVFAQVQYAAPSSADRLYEAVVPVMARAVRAGAEFELHTPAERSEMCAGYLEVLAEAEAARQS